MIRERIEDKMVKRGLTQTELCGIIGYTVQNFNAFLHGKRSLPYSIFIGVSKELKLTVGDKGNETSSVDISLLPTICSEKVKKMNYKVKDVSQKSGLNITTIYGFINCRHDVSTGTIEKVMNALNLELVDYRA